MATLSKVKNKARLWKEYIYNLFVHVHVNVHSILNTVRFFLYSVLHIESAVSQMRISGNNILLLCASFK